MAKGVFWGAVSGFTSFVSHAGGPPYQIYVTPLRLAPRIFAGTMVVFFFIVNALKLVPYFFLGQFARANLLTSAVLAADLDPGDVPRRLADPAHRVEALLRGGLRCSSSRSASS